MNYLRPLKHWAHGFESYLRHGCESTFSVCVVLCRSWLRDRLIPCPRSLLTACKIKTLKWNEAFHRCLMLQRKHREMWMNVLWISCWMCVESNYIEVSNKNMKCALQHNRAVPIVYYSPHFLFYAINHPRFLLLLCCNTISHSFS
jgi:hypothetical protein